jgi:hypothetical protein
MCATARRFVLISAPVCMKSPGFFEVWFSPALCLPQKRGSTMSRFTFLRPSLPVVFEFDGAKIEIVDTPAAFHDLGAKRVTITDRPRSFVFFVNDGGDLVSASFERTEVLNTIDSFAAQRVRTCASIAAKRLAVMSVRIVSQRVAVDYVRAELNPEEPQTGQIEFLRPSQPVRFTVDYVRAEITDTIAKHWNEGAKTLTLKYGHESWVFFIDDPRSYVFGRFDRDRNGVPIPPESVDRVAYVAELARRRMIQMGVFRVYAPISARFAHLISG